MDEYIITHNGPMGTAGQQNAAAAFYARNRAATKCKAMAIPSHVSMEDEDCQEDDTIKRETDFAGLLTRCPPQTPSFLLKRMEEKEEDPLTSSKGKVKVIVDF